MSNKELFKYIDTNHKDFYKEWYVESCELIIKETGKGMGEGDCLVFLHSYFNQVKSGKN